MSCTTRFVSTSSQADSSKRQACPGGFRRACMYQTGLKTAIRIGGVFAQDESRQGFSCKPEDSCATLRRTTPRRPKRNRRDPTNRKSVLDNKHTEHIHGQSLFAHCAQILHVFGSKRTHSDRHLCRFVRTFSYSVRLVVSFCTFLSMLGTQTVQASSENFT